MLFSTPSSWPTGLSRDCGNCLLLLSPQTVPQPLTTLSLLPPSLCHPALASQPDAPCFFLEIPFTEIEQDSDPRGESGGNQGCGASWSLVPGDGISRIQMRRTGHRKVPSKVTLESIQSSTFSPLSSLALCCSSNTQNVTASGPLHLLFPLPRMCLPTYLNDSFSISVLQISAQIFS